MTYRDHDLSSRKELSGSVLGASFSSFLTKTHEPARALPRAALPVRFGAEVVLPNTLPASNGTTHQNPASMWHPSHQKQKGRSGQIRRFFLVAVICL